MPEFQALNKTVPQAVLEDKVLQAVASALDLDPGRVTLTASLQHDLGAESLDYLDIAFTLERSFKVHFPREDLLVRAGEHFGEQNLVDKGVVTALGLRMLQHAAPEIDPEALRPGLRATDVPGLFRVQTFVRVLDRLLAAKESLSTICPHCQATLAESPTLPEFVCPGCNASVPFPSGDDVMFQDLVSLRRDVEAGS